METYNSGLEVIDELIEAAVEVFLVLEFASGEGTEERRV